MKNKTVEKLMRFLITLLGAGIGAALAALILPLFSRWYPIESPYAPIALYAALCLVGAAVCFAFSSAIIGRTMKLIAAIERRWDAMPTQQIVLTSIGMIMGLVVAALITQLILSAGASDYHQLQRPDLCGAWVCGTSDRLPPLSRRQNPAHAPSPAPRRRGRYSG